MPDTHAAAKLTPKIVGAGQGRSINAFGIPMQIMLRAEETGGAFASLIAELAPGEGPPPHFHHDHEEYFFVLEGEIALEVGGQAVTAGPGSMVFVPRETVHAFKCTSATPAKILEWATPGGQERYFEAIDKLAAEGKMNPENIVAVSKDFETEFVG